MKQILLFLFAILLSTFVIAAAPSETRYTVVFGGNAAGSQVVKKIGNHEWQISYEYNDRGRGPKIDARIVTDENWIPTLVEDRGQNYFKSPVDEKFSLEKGKATWKNAGEEGSKEVTRSAFYLSFDGVPQELGFLARALLAAPDHKLDLLPEGEVRIEKIGELTVSTGKASRKVIQYSMSGLGLTPSPVWLDQDGVFFARADSSSSVTPEGWQDTVSALLRAQNETESARTRQLAEKLAHHAQGPVVFKNVRVFDSEKAIMVENQTVVISGNRIHSVGPADQVEVPANAQVINGTGKTLIPGLWDMHVHLGDSSDGPLFLANGVTTVRDLGNSIDYLGKTRDDYAAGRAIGPRVVMAGIIDGPGPYHAPTTVLVDTEEKAREAVDRYAKLGYVQIKIYSSVKPELVPAIIDEAHKLGLRVSGHIPAFMTAEQCVKLGYDEIQHVNFLFLNFWADKVADTRTRARFTALGENAALLDLNSQPVRDFIHLLQEHKTVSDPTVNAFQSLLVDRPGKIASGFEAIGSRLPPQLRRALLAGGLPVEPEMDQRYRDSFQALLHMVKLLYDSGITIVAGTDAFAGFSLPHELELYVQAGIPAPAVLQIATIGGARVMKMDKDFGSITAGKYADVVLVSGDPSKNISDVRNAEMVMKDGVLYLPVELFHSLGISDDEPQRHGDTER